MQQIVRLSVWKNKHLLQSKLFLLMAKGETRIRINLINISFSA